MSRNAPSVTHIDNVGNSSPSISQAKYSHSGSHSGHSQHPHTRHHMPVNYDEYDYLCKLLVIGDSGAGKSALLTRFADGEFHTGYSSTIGVDFSVRSIEVQTKKGQKKTVKLQMWDTAGQERFRTITSAYYRGAHAVLLVFDVTVEESFANTRKWLSELDAVSTRAGEGIHGGKTPAGQSDAEDHPATRNTQVLLVANKCDLVRSRVVEPHRIAELARELGVGFIEASAKSGGGVDEAFQDVAERFVRQRMADEAEGRWVPGGAGGMHGSKSLKVNGRRMDGDDDDEEQSGWRKCFGACSIM